ncbi:MAG: PorP/SprF family type IX secretion system membrane protein [Bacteroidia bacterium]|jgi:type IX secretion system PorP/SprF family membrane protein|nr:PorP/SprF family type IX secretion system membrane protein [Bacteroidia bacterium]
MKKLLLVWTALIGAVGAYAQQDPQFTQFFRTRLNYNPAYAGSQNDKICLGFIGRSQWLGLGSNDKGQSPQTIVGDISAPLFRNRIGVGLNINQDALGHESTLMPTFSFAYHYTFPNSHKLSGGIGVGILQKSLDGKKLRPQQQGDNLIPTAVVNDMAVDFSFGVLYQIPNIAMLDNVYIGLSSTHLTEPTVEYVSRKFNAVRHYYLMMGAVYNLPGGSFTLEPNIFIKNAVKTSFDINLSTTYNSKILGGLSYRNVDALAIMGGYKFTEVTTAMVSYDLTTSRLSQFSNGTVELSIRHCFRFKSEPPVRIVRPIFTPRFL